MRKISVSYNNPEQTIQTFLKQNNIQVRLPWEKFSNTFNPNESGERTLTVEDGTERKGMPPSYTKNDKNVKGLNLLEGLYLLTQFPEILDDHAIDLTESLYSMECIPTIYKWENQLFLTAICPDVTDTMCGAPYVAK